MFEGRVFSRLLLPLNRLLPTKCSSIGGNCTLLFSRCLTPTLQSATTTMLVNGSSGNPHFYSTSTSCCMPLSEFRDPLSREKRTTEIVGRSWSVTELQRKSFDDLHKLWWLLYKERNMLLTERHLSRRRNIVFVQPERLRKVSKSMGAIKHVLGDRKRDYVSQLTARQLESIETATAADIDDNDDEVNEKSDTDAAVTEPKK